ncbi:MAG: aminodeoxychorismate/anthranilate synthase component II [Erysipelotrichaceae bacterium]|nr:aminodeoxychorismate/anthranilate synthase component II [Erysipelotrichaceae bacterium]MDD3809211.1 aminodeoxychorismate/anthranilate synthase component II [Erysipelotrichaceae bacterium]
MIFLLDNYDSFVYNLAAYIRESGEEIIVKRADEVDLEQIKSMSPDGIIISPGPKRPQDAKLSITVVKEFQGKIPLLGVCLGHQVIAHFYGANVIKGKIPVHGKVTPIINNGQGIFEGLPERYQVTRYHSLVVAKASIPTFMQIDATTDDGVVMGISHKEYPLYGVQFHPEAVLSEYGHELLKNFIEISKDWRYRHGNNQDL